MSDVIKIGFDEEEFNDYTEFDDEEISRHGERFSEVRRKDVYLPPKMITQIKDEFDCVVVNDFGDDYHLTEEERAANNKFYQLFKELKNTKASYRKIDEYVTVMRKCLKCLDAVAENNGVFDPEEFKRSVLKGRISVTGLRFPRYKGKDRKDIGWDYVTEFILGDDDPKKLVAKRKDEIYTDEEMDERIKLLFTEEELKDIFKPSNDEEEYHKQRVYDPDTLPSDDFNIIPTLSEKEVRKIIKKDPDYLREIKSIKKDQESSQILRSSFAYELNSSDMEEIEKYDMKHNFESSSSIPEFNGNILSKKEYNEYMAKLIEYENENIKENYLGKMRTKNEIRDLQVKELLESKGWNIRNLWNNKEKEKKLKKRLKRDKEREKQLKQQLMKVQNRRQRRMGEDVDKEDKSKKKKGKKKKEKKSKISKKNKQFEKESKEAIDQIILSQTGRSMEDFKDYKSDVLDWSWENVLKD